MTSRDRNDRSEILWRAAEMGDTCTAAEALGQDLDIDASNNHGITALMRAVAAGRIQMVRLLLEHGADPNRSRNDGFTALLLAAFFGHTDIVRILIQYGADTKATTRFGTSAQMWARSRTFKSVADCLQNSEMSVLTSEIDKRNQIQVGSTDAQHQTLVKPVAESNRQLNSKSNLEIVEPTVTDTAPMLASSVGHIRRIPVLHRKLVLACTAFVMFLASVTSATLMLLPDVAPVSNTIQQVATDETRDVAKESVQREIVSQSFQQPDAAKQPESAKEASNNFKEPMLIKSSKPLSVQPRVATTNSSTSEKTEQSVSAPINIPAARPLTPSEPRPTTTGIVAHLPGVARSSPPPPLSSQLISPSKNSTKSGKVIAWP